MELTAAEYPVAKLITMGYSEKEVADKLCLSPKTVHTHTYNIRKKNRLRSCVDIAREFILSLDNPKQYFASLALLAIQLFMIIDDATFDLRKLSARESGIEVVSRKGRHPKKDDYDF